MRLTEEKKEKRRRLYETHGGEEGEEEKGRRTEMTRRIEVYVGGVVERMRERKREKEMK